MKVLIALIKIVKDWENVYSVKCLPWKQGPTWVWIPNTNIKVGSSRMCLYPQHWGIRGRRILEFAGQLEWMNQWAPDLVRDHISENKVGRCSVLTIGQYIRAHMHEYTHACMHAHTCTRTHSHDLAYISETSSTITKILEIINLEKGKVSAGSQL